MSITNYAELKAAIASWLKRSDLTAQIPDFIRLAEVRLKSLIDVRDFETTVDLSTTPNSPTVSLPGDFKSPIALWVDDINPREKLDQVITQNLPYTNTPGRPLYWAIDGDNIRFQSPAYQVYPLKFRYTQLFELSDTNTTNFVLSQYPDVYLFGALYEAADYTFDDNNAAKWQAKFVEAVQRANDQENSNQKFVPLLTEFGQVMRRRFNIYRGY